eukprot:scaffold24151_cov90-Isochrysis_galbana.AAC.3
MGLHRIGPRAVAEAVLGCAHHAGVVHPAKVGCQVLCSNRHRDKGLPPCVTGREADADTEGREDRRGGRALLGDRQLDHDALAIGLAQRQATRDELLPPAAPRLQHQLVRAQREGLVGEPVTGRQRARDGCALEEHRICRHA